MCKNGDNRLLFLQIERLKNEFEKSLKNYSAQQQVMAIEVFSLSADEKINIKEMTSIRFCD